MRATDGGKEPSGIRRIRIVNRRGRTVATGRNGGTINLSASVYRGPVRAVAQDRAGNGSKPAGVNVLACRRGNR